MEVYYFGELCPKEKMARPQNAWNFSSNRIYDVDIV